MTEELSRYAFAAEPAYARRLQARYAALFAEGPVADLGSGRGYFLEALRDRGIEGVAVDTSDEARGHAAALGLRFIQQDVLDYLAGAGDLRGIFAAHLIEHLEPVTAVAMIRMATSALAHGGRMVVVTPNMADHRTWTETFWMDTTHVRPYPARLIAALMEQEGLVVDVVGRGRTPQGRRAIPRVILGRLRFGRDYGSTEVFVSAHKP